MIAIENRPDTSRQETGSDAFRAEYKLNTPKKVLTDDVVSYLGEYRFKLPEYSYKLDFADGELIDPNRRESMESMSQRAIDFKKHQNRSSVREQAEKTGFQRLNWQLKDAKDGDTIVWMSPMGPKSEGYGDYGFIFFGKVSGDSSDKAISMVAKRIESPTIGQFNKLNAILTQEATDYRNAEDFLANPKVLGKNLSEKDFDSLLRNVFSLKLNKTIQEIFERVIEQMSAVISDLADLLRNPWKTIKEKRTGLNSVENYALKLKDDFENYQRQSVIYIKNQDIHLRVADIAGDFGHKPPAAAGSCGSTASSLTSSNIFSKGSLLNAFFGDEADDYDFDQDGPCKQCGAIEVKCGPCGICKSCDLAIRASRKFSFN